MHIDMKEEQKLNLQNSIKIKIIKFIFYYFYIYIMKVIINSDITENTKFISKNVYIIIIFLIVI